MKVYLLTSFSNAFTLDLILAMVRLILVLLEAVFVLADVLRVPAFFRVDLRAVVLAFLVFVFRVFIFLLFEWFYYTKWCCSDF